MRQVSVKNQHELKPDKCKTVFIPRRLCVCLLLEKGVYHEHLYMLCVVLLKEAFFFNLGCGFGRFQCLPAVRQWILCANFVIAAEETSFAFYFFVCQYFTNLLLEIWVALPG